MITYNDIKQRAEQFIQSSLNKDLMVNSFYFLTPRARFVIEWTICGGIKGSLRAGVSTDCVYYVNYVGADEPVTARRGNGDCRLRESSAHPPSEIVIGHSLGLRVAPRSMGNV